MPPLQTWVGEKSQGWEFVGGENPTVDDSRLLDEWQLLCATVMAGKHQSEVSSWYYHDTYGPTWANIDFQFSNMIVYMFQKSHIIELQL